MRWWIVAALIASSGCSSKETKAATPGCDLSGLYRLRFDAEVGQWLWFRFRIDPSGQTAKLETPSAFGAVPMTIDPDPAACKASVIAKAKSGDVLASVTLDPKTNKVTGTIRPAGARATIALEGVRDQGAIPTGEHACVTPGVYKLVVPSEQAWLSSVPDKNADCSEATLEVPFLVEPWGDKVIIDQLDADGTASWGAEDVAVVGLCEFDVRFRHRERMVEARITFSGDKVTAEASYATAQVVTKHGDSWRCTIPTPMAWVERVAK